MTRIFSYIVEHDVGFAPHPFGRLCSLANCKQDIRRAASVGDFIIGTGSKQDGLDGHLTYWMRVDEIISFDDYWSDPRFVKRKPTLNGSWSQWYGDNIYHTAEDGSVRQLDSFHSQADGSPSVKDLTTDTGKTDRVLLARDFVYFGERAPAIPLKLSIFVLRRQGYKCHFTDALKDEMIAWLVEMRPRGLRGLPRGWKPRLKRPRSRRSSNT